MILIIETRYIFIKKSPPQKKIFHLLKDTQNFPYPRLNVVPSLKKLRQAVTAMNEQANLQPTLNKGGGGASLIIFVTDCL